MSDRHAALPLKYLDAQGVERWLLQLDLDRAERRREGLHERLEAALVLARVQRDDAADRLPRMQASSSGAQQTL